MIKNYVTKIDETLPINLEGSDTLFNHTPITLMDFIKNKVKEFSNRPAYRIEIDRSKNIYKTKTRHYS